MLLPARASPALFRLETEIEQLAAWWQGMFAVAITDPPTEPNPAAVVELRRRTTIALARLSAELGVDDDIDPR